MSVLYAGRDEPVPDGLTLEKIPPTRLRQVEAWMDRFFPGFELDLQKIPHTNAVTLGLRTSKDVNFHAPVHTGYGLTQVLPIIVAALSRPNSLLLIENPEVHLHPAGQAAMGEFLAEVATTSAQVIVETHSDHVLNGIRRAVKKRLLPPMMLLCISFGHDGTASRRDFRRCTARSWTPTATSIRGPTGSLTSSTRT